MDHSDGEGTRERPQSSLTALLWVLFEAGYMFDKTDVHAFASNEELGEFMQGYSEMQEWRPAKKPRVGDLQAVTTVRPPYSGRGGRKLSPNAQTKQLELEIEAGVERQGDDEVLCWDMTPAHVAWIERIIAHEGVRHETVAELPADASNFLAHVSLIIPPMGQQFPNLIAMSPAVRRELALQMPHGRPSKKNFETWQDAMDRAQTDKARKKVEQQATRGFTKKMIGVGYHVRPGTSVVDHRQRENPDGEIQYIITRDGWNNSARAGSSNGGHRRKL